MPEEKSSESKVPYIAAYGNISKVLEKIKQAAVPPRFTQDFLATKLGMTGGGAKPVIPFLKRMGFLGSDGVPTDSYKKFRNDSESGAVAHQALRKAFVNIYEVNEYAHELTDKDLKGVIVQVTGLEGSSSTIKSIIGSFHALKKFAKFDEVVEEPVEQPEQEKNGNGNGTQPPQDYGKTPGINLGYTINLNLPATSDIAVFNAIFKSLRDHLMK